MAQCGEFTTNDVYNSLKELFAIEDQKNIKQYCEFGLLNYDYTYYLRVSIDFGKNNIWEDLLNLLRSKDKDIKNIIRCINDNYCDIIDSFRHYAENALINNYNIPEQRNLKMQYLFNLINIIVEIYIKPQILLHYNLLCSKDRNKSLGEMTNTLSEYNKLYKFILNEYLNDLNINQWRNIAEHKSYRMDRDGNIHISYNNGNQKRVINLQFLEDLVRKIDLVGCLFRLVFDIIEIDYFNLLDEKTIKKHSENIPSEGFEGREITLFEMSKNYGIEVLKSEYKKDVYYINLKSLVELQKNEVIDYINNLTKIVPSDNIEVKIENTKKKVVYTIKIKERRAEIYKWKS